MTTEGGIRVMTGVLVLISLLLGAPQSPLFLSTLWLWLAAFTAVGVAQSGITGHCPAEVFLRKLGLRSEADLDDLGAPRSDSSLPG